MQLELTEHTHEARCPFCRGKLVGERLWTCPRCGTSLHAGCFQEHGRCTTHGCETLRGGAVPVAPPRSTWRDTLRALVVPAILVVAVAFLVRALDGRSSERHFELDPGPNHEARSVEPEPATSTPTFPLVVHCKVEAPVRPAFLANKLVLVTQASYTIDPLRDERETRPHTGEIIHAVLGNRVLMGQQSLVGSHLSLERDDACVGWFDSRELFHEYALPLEGDDVLAASWSAVERWDAKSGERLARFELPGITALALESHLDMILVGDDEGRVHILDARGVVQRREVALEGTVHAVGFSRALGLHGVAVTSGARTEIYEISLLGKATRRIELPGRTSAVAFVPPTVTGAHTEAPTALVVATFEGRVWYVELDDPCVPGVPFSLVRPIAKNFWATSAAVSPDGKHVALGALGGGEVRLVELSTGRFVSAILLD